MMGLAFKPNIDDLRESPAVYIAQKVLQAAGEEGYFIVEPNVHEHPYYKLTDANTAVEQADVIAFLVAHNEFKELAIPAGKLVLDFCGVTNK
jgi:UDP-N-acetyl-D-mannosaminuronic acid dehydrogenase